jgi:GTP cyclohydrolase I
MDLETPATSRTPERFLKALLDSTAGYEGDPKLLTAFPTE